MPRASCEAEDVPRASGERPTRLLSATEPTAEVRQQRALALPERVRGGDQAQHGVDVPVPDGAFYMMLPVDDDDQAWCEGAIQEAQVATVPGSAFGAPGYARISYANSTERLQEAVSRLVDHGYL